MKCVRPERGKIRGVSVKQTDELATIIESSRGSATKPFESVMNEIAARISELVHYPYCSILLAYSGKENLSISGAYGLSSDYVNLINRKYTVPPGSGPSGLAYARGWSFAVDDVFKDPAFNKWRSAAAEAGYASVVSVPIMTSCQKIGSLTCYSPYKHVFSEQEMLWLLAIGRATGSAIQIASFVSSQNEAIARLEEMNMLLKQQHELFKQYEETSGSLTRMVLVGEGPDRLVKALARIIRRPVLFEDRALRLVWAARPDEEEGHSGGNGPPFQTLQELVQNPKIKRLLVEMNRTLQPVELPMLPETRSYHGRIIYPVALGDEILGYLSAIIDGNDLIDVNLKVMESAASALAFSLIKSHTIMQFNLKRRSNFLHALITNKDLPEATLKEEAEEIGGSGLIPYRAMCVEARRSCPSSEDDLNRLLDFVSDVITANNPLALIKKGRQRLTVLFPEGKNGKSAGALDVAKRASEAVQRIAENAWLVAGIGSKKEHFSEFHRSFWEAERVVELLSISDPTKGKTSTCLCECFDGLGIASLLLGVQDPREVQAFASQTLRAVMDHDSKYKTQLLHTLRVYLNMNCQNQVCSQKLNIHPNTLSYRLRKVEDLTGKSLSNLDDLMAMNLALKIIELFPAGFAR